VKFVRGVFDRILDLADRDAPQINPSRPPYRYQIPLPFIPGLGKRKLELLLDRFGTEMNILHQVPEIELADAVGLEIAQWILQARHGHLTIDAGGGGRYGKVSTDQVKPV
jgi:PHP family Zn ribbon phosphoesterase